MLSLISYKMSSSDEEEKPIVNRKRGKRCWDPSKAAGYGMKAVSVLSKVAPQEYAQGLEAAIRQKHPPALSKDNQTQYATLVRRMAFNLKRNPDLINRYDPETLCTRTPMDLAQGTPMYKYYEEYEQREMQKYATNNADVQDSPLHQCARCKSRKITVYMLQTRSADEPMSEFYTCHNPSCRRVWKQ